MVTLASADVTVMILASPPRCMGTIVDLDAVRSRGLRLLFGDDDEGRDRQHHVLGGGFGCPCFFCWVVVWPLRRDRGRSSVEIQKLHQHPESESAAPP